VVPRPEKLYFLVGRPIDMARYRGREGDPEVLRVARNQVRRSLERLIKDVRQCRAKGKPRGGIRRLLNEF
jgi:hypothetical protein